MSETGYKNHPLLAQIANHDLSMRKRIATLERELQQARPDAEIARLAREYVAALRVWNKSRQWYDDCVTLDRSEAALIAAVSAEKKHGGVA